ncbi:TonB-dependent receptor [uncultured Shewanella sp.]|uniref:TonB-dependent receptor n=1 Tax=uncultured Shewanella sp. TaxID=173975 RepID=UPI0026135956|nr:TonB-dependent receptor [uncultured Shewanella sp.]
MKFLQGHSRKCVYNAISALVAVSCGIESFNALANEVQQIEYISATFYRQNATTAPVSMSFLKDEDDVSLTNYGEATREQSIDRLTLGLTHEAECDWGGTKTLFNSSAADLYDYNSRYSLQAPLSRDIKETLTIARATVFLPFNFHDVTFGTAFSVPILFEPSRSFSSVSCSGVCQISGNPDLKEEISVNNDVLVPVNKEDWSISLTLFNNTVKELITVEAWNGESFTSSYFYSSL